MKIFLAFSLILTSLMLACGPGAATTVPPASNTIEPTIVQVTLNEFEITSSLTEFQVGVPYRFVVTNNGTVNHDFSITPPVAQHGSNPHGDAHDDALAVIDANDMPPGATKSIEVIFNQIYTANQIELACHTPGHYEAGMKMPIRVKN